MVKKMTLLLHLRNLFVTKSPVICHILALSNSSSERRKDVNEERQQPQGFEDQNGGMKVQMALLRAKLVSLIAEVRSLTVDIETQKLENYVLQKEVQTVKIIV